MSKRKRGRSRGRLISNGESTYLTTSDAANQGDRSCPIRSVDVRLEHCHKYWHETAANYGDPDEFTRHLNSLIQELRNVTWNLQSLKGDLQARFDFSTWYAVEQDRMRSDPVLKWLNDARVKITKKSGLDTYSTVEIRIRFDYESTPWIRLRNTPQVVGDRAAPTAEEAVQVPLPASAPLDQYLRRIEHLSPRVIDGGMIERERLWVDPDLPEWEVLDACAHAFTDLSLMVDRLHDKLDRGHGLAVMHDGVGRAVHRLADHRWPCMSVDRELRTSRISLKDGRRDVGGKRWAVEPDQKSLAKARKRYGLADVRVELSAGFEQAADYFMERARIAMEVDGYHGWYVLLFKGQEPVGLEILAARDRADKIVVLENLARTIDRSAIDGLIMISDAWTAPLPTSSDEDLPLEDRPDRSETIIVHAEDAQGNRRTLWSPYERKGKRIVWASETPIVAPSGMDRTLIAIRTVWARRRQSKFAAFRPASSEDN